MVIVWQWQTIVEMDEVILSMLATLPNTELTLTAVLFLCSAGIFS